MTENVYERVSINHCVYVRISNLGTSIVAIHANKMCVATSSPGKMQKLKGDLKKKIDIVELGKVHFLLGIMVT